ncbi:hypothetical protein LZ554_006636 [Drepanopeziza brunnea f. sp. 'monogermtubi']|nr:hypothetical protein LZ554_006636 [Drepanopeziza brunnea f. sp. 'monogermtubi']
MSISTPAPLPTYIYKILPPSAAPPHPLPLSLPLSALDAQDEFLHLSTSPQLLGTLQNFFPSEPHVYVLRIPYERVADFVVWEDANGEEPGEDDEGWDVEDATGFFPHVYANAGPGEGELGLKLGRDEVESVGVWKRGRGKWTPDGWPFGEDVPKA